MTTTIVSTLESISPALGGWIAARCLGHETKSWQLTDDKTNTIRYTLTQTDGKIILIMELLK